MTVRLTPSVISTVFAVDSRVSVTAFQRMLMSLEWRLCPLRPFLLLLFLCSPPPPPPPPFSSQHLVLWLVVWALMVQYFCLFDLRAWATCSEATYFGCLYACRCLRAATKFLHAVVAICGQSSCSVVPQLWPRSFSSASTVLCLVGFGPSLLRFPSSVHGGGPVSVSVSVSVSVFLFLSLCMHRWPLQ